MMEQREFKGTKPIVIVETNKKKKKKLSVFMSFVLAVSMLMGITMDVSAAENPGLVGGSSDKVQVYIKPDVTIILNGTISTFFNANGEVVHPIIFNGSTYLPIRAVAKLLDEEIQWDSVNQTIYIGKTLLNPNKVKRTTPEVIEQPGSIVSYMKVFKDDAYLKPNIKIMYDFVFQQFYNVNNDLVYPLIYQGTTYLPVRSVSQLMNMPVVWNASSKTIVIGSAEKPVIEEKTKNSEFLIDIFNKQLAVYDDSTVSIQNMSRAQSFDDIAQIRAQITEYNNVVVSELESLANYDVSRFNDQEINALDALISFMESSEQYITILENIAYLASEGQDYSVLAELFIESATISQGRLDEARVLIQSL